MDHRDMRDIMDHLSDEIMVFDAHYRMVYVNEACRRHYGLPPEALIGKTFDELDGTFWGNSTLPEVYATKKRVAHRRSRIRAATSSPSPSPCWMRTATSATSSRTSTTSRRSTGSARRRSAPCRSRRRRAVPPIPASTAR